MKIAPFFIDLVYRHSFTVKPGFFLEHFGDRFLRNTFLSESAISGIESNLFDKNYADVLYRVGKEFGYNYASFVPLPRRSSSFRNQLLSGLIDFFQTVYGKCLDYTVSWDEKTLEMHFDDTIVCRKNSLGIYTASAAAGIWAYINNDKALEGIQTTCIGKGNSFCTYLFGPEKHLGKIKYSHSDFQQANFNPLYLSLNQEIPFEEEEYNLDVLTQVGLVKQRTSYFDFSGERFFPVEISYLNNLEKALSNCNADLRTLLYLPVFDSFNKLGKTLTNYGKKESTALDLISKVLSAFGWGIIKPIPSKQIKLSIKGFPWTPELDEAKTYTYFTASLSGFLSGITGINREFKVKDYNTVGNSRELLLELVSYE